MSIINRQPIVFNDFNFKDSGTEINKKAGTVACPGFFSNLRQQLLAGFFGALFGAFFVGGFLRRFFDVLFCILRFSHETLLI